MTSGGERIRFIVLILFMRFVLFMRFIRFNGRVCGEGLKRLRVANQETI